MHRRFWFIFLLGFIAVALFGEQPAPRNRSEEIKLQLPVSMRQAPPIFSLKPATQPIRVLAFGDYGDGSQDQKDVAAAMLAYHQQHAFDFAITLGDNFYSKGMKGLDDPRWKSWWDELYDPIGIQFYATLGNHDYGFEESPAAEIQYSQQSPSWRMPATQYVFTAGPVQFFAIDTQVMTSDQLEWLHKELEASRSVWKVVYGHHPIFSHGHHGNTERLVEELLPILTGRADIYLSGHDHDMQHLKPEGNLHFFVAGSGGKLRPITAGERSLFARSALGFAVLEANHMSLKVTFIEKSLTPLYHFTLTKERPARD
jgi:predicted phosphodiesterase